MSSSAPPAQILAMRLDHIIGKAMSGDLAIMLLALAKTCSKVADDEYFSQSEPDC